MVVEFISILKEIREAALISANEDSVYRQLRLNEELRVIIGGRDPRPPVYGVTLKHEPKVESKRSGGYRTRTSIDRKYGG